MGIAGKSVNSLGLEAMRSAVELAVAEAVAERAFFLWRRMALVDIAASAVIGPLPFALFLRASAAELASLIGTISDSGLYAYFWGGLVGPPLSPHLAELAEATLTATAERVVSRAIDLRTSSPT